MKVVYQLVLNLSIRDYVEVGRYESRFVPKVGDIVSVDGNPFIVYSVIGCINEEYDYIYVSVFKAGNFKFNIGEKIF